MAVRWEIAMFHELLDPFILFSHNQPESTVSDVKNVLGKGLREKDSNRRYLSLDRKNLSNADVMNFLGERGFELVSVSMSHPYRTYAFKRQLG